MSYDGSTALQPVVAGLLGISTKSQVKIAEVTREAKEALGIDTKLRRLQTDDKVRVYEYLKAQQSKQDDGQTPKSEQISVPEQPQCPEQDKTPVDIISQTVETISQPTDNIISQDVELNSQDSVGLISQPVGIATQLLEVTLNNNVITNVKVKNDVKTNSHDDNHISQANNFGNVRFGVYLTMNGERKRQVISVDGFFVNALASVGVLRKDLPQWVQGQVDGWTAFDSKLPITRQIKYLIVREIVKGLGGDDHMFYGLAE